MLLCRSKLRGKTNTDPILTADAANFTKLFSIPPVSPQLLQPPRIALNFCPSGI